MPDTDSTTSPRNFWHYLSLFLFTLVVYRFFYSKYVPYQIYLIFNKTFLFLILFFCLGILNRNASVWSNALKTLGFFLVLSISIGLLYSAADYELNTYGTLLFNKDYLMTDLMGYMMGFFGALFIEKANGRS